MTVTVEHLTKKFRSNRALDDISFTLQSGVYGLLGPNGSGKTTLLRCLTDIYRYDGKIRLDEQELHANRALLAGVGYLPQGFGLFRELTLTEMLAYFCTLKGIPKQAQRERIDATLEQVHLTEERDKRGGALSGGMVRRAGIAQAMLGDPALVLLDEPTAGLDPEERLRFKNAVMNRKPEQTILLSTHIVEDVAALCDQIIILSKGRIRMQGTAEELRARADGCVYEVDAEQAKTLRGDYTVIRQDGTAEAQRLRVFSKEPQPGNPVEPTLEDGYLCVIQEQDHA